MGRKKVFISYTRSDQDWAHWIGWTLKDGGHTPFVHEWELPIGGNIPAWMEKRLGEADRAIGVFSDNYCTAIFSSAERNAAIWRDEYGESGFFLPIEVRKVAKWPVFASPLSRLSLIGLTPDEAVAALLAALEPPAPPSTAPAFPGHRTIFTADGQYLGQSGMKSSTAKPFEESPGETSDESAKPKKYIRDHLPRDASDPASLRRRRAAAAGDVAVPESEPLPELRPPLPIG